MFAEVGNLCLNPGFQLWPWGTGGFAGVASSVNFGKTAAAWFAQKTSGGTDDVEISRGTTPASTKYPHWLRDKYHMQISVNSLTANNRLMIRQFLDRGQDFGQVMLAVTILCSGPAGARFRFGAGGVRKTVITEGDDGDGNPNIVTARLLMPFDNPAYDYMRVTPFESPSETGDYRLYFVQVEPFMSQTFIGRGFEMRLDEDEWHHLRRYIQPIPGGRATGQLSPNTQVRRLYEGPPGCGMRQAPVIPTEGRAASVAVALMTSNSLITAASPSFAIGEHSNAYAGDIVIGGFSGLSSSAEYRLINPAGTPALCYLSAERF